MQRVRRRGCPRRTPRAARRGRRGPARGRSRPASPSGEAGADARLGVGEPEGGRPGAERAHRGGQQGRRDPVDAQGAGEGRRRVLQRAGLAGGALGHAPGGAQLLLVPRALPGAVDRDAGGAGGAVRPRCRHGAHHHREPAGGRDQLERDLVEAAVDVQQRSQVGLPVDPAAHRQEVLQPRRHPPRPVARGRASPAPCGWRRAPCRPGPGPAARRVRRPTDRPTRPSYVSAR